MVQESFYHQGYSKRLVLLPSPVSASDGIYFICLILIFPSLPGIGYLHSNEASKPTIVHQNVSVEKVILDHEFNPLIMDAGLPKLLADDVVFSALKASAAMGYLAPEYITTGRFTEKSDIYAFGVIVLQVLSGKALVGGSIRVAVEAFRFEDFVDTNLKGDYSKSEAAILSKLAIVCTHEVPELRPTMVEVIQELAMLPLHSS